MSESLNPVAPHDLPSFIAAPGETDVLMVIAGLFLVFAVVMFGILFLRLHALPEHIAHGSHKVQYEIVAVLGLLALFTHLHIFWVAGLILAFIDFPDFSGLLGRMTKSVERIAGIKSSEDESAAAGPIAPPIQPQIHSSKPKQHA